ncbi:hypothetical protein [Bradyrhizobium diazoefficiens]|uniref:Helix-turn-helix domain-containing protein n=1 Tax=Bradyrhizobium diazoefficiens TaxID=1355477 RepID=A0A809X5Y9_9BRAD|nr:hypothetical protein [Bradyrhizobium diazoefficiens]WLA70006.1 hypothetical protein QIH77_24160 [Bradyrhizobium diazoefficiens]BCE22395.1 hypothetical protein XF1B_50760 [Bradyrhizobium diazoefficiens]BCE48659.1 hypothetical protein XF4B_50080 [Bradyrhizobium diazoefficiens]BCE92175.1 hypothetical protein XF10B_49730 [Bradyrhizobium diazoefficiens]BCF27102.1 hypothetical protein XF14B_50540 [Bradyrhizobium diazoefficiens]
MSGSNRRKYHQIPINRGRYIRLTEFMMASPAWQSLDGNCRALYIEVARRYRGPNSNNGAIPYSVREAATALRVGRSTAQRCFDALLDRGFLKIGKRSGFNMKGRAATEWLLTEFPDERTAGPSIATKEFMSWTPENSFHSPVSDTQSPTSEPPLALRRDRVA